MCIHGDKGNVRQLAKSRCLELDVYFDWFSILFCLLTSTLAQALASSSGGGFETMTQMLGKHDSSVHDVNFASAWPHGPSTRFLDSSQRWSSEPGR